MNQKKIGEACMSSDDCARMPYALVDGGLATTDYCGSTGVCTRDCNGQLDCPQGFDCGLAKAGDAKASCYKQTWDATAMGGFGTSCAIVASGCSTKPSPCAAGFDCFARLKCDPDAVCSKACASDTDCPPSMFCGASDIAFNGAGYFSAAMGDKVCQPRTFCSDCAVDDQCPRGFLCIVDKSGKNHYCAQKCGSTADCHQPLNGASNFETCVPDQGGKGTVCLPGNGYCKGPSPIDGQTGDGKICSPCRIGVPGDCSMDVTGMMGGCFAEGFDTERFCTIPCQVTINTQGRVSADTCPMNTYCAIGPVSQAGKYKGYCSADSSYSGPTCYP